METDKTGRFSGSEGSKMNSGSGVINGAPAAGGGDAGDMPANRKKYSEALKTLLPYRTSPSKMKSNVLPSSKSGVFSFATASWLSVLMWKALREGLKPSDLWDLKDVDKAEHNARRLTKLWEEEKKVDGENASFTKAVWKFGKTRFLVCIFLLIVSVIFQFLGPAWILKAILAFTEDLSQPVEIGLLLAVFAFIAQLVRNLTFNGLWMMGIHTGMRLEGAMQLMTYEKLLRLRNGGDKVLSQAITFCTNDQERIFECVAGGVLAFAAPVMFLMCLTYTTIVLGPWALLGNLVIFLFYPIMGTVARFIAERRRKTVKVTNQRVGLMTEILNSIRLIKMYGWEKNFTKKIKDIRKNEEDLLKKVAFMQSLTSTLTPMVNIVASILTFVGFTLSGNNLTAAEAFTIFSVFAAMQFTTGTLPYAARAIGESIVCFRNFKKYLELPEFQNESDESIVCQHDSVIAIEEGSFAWENDEESNQVDQPQPRRRRKKKKENSSADVPLSPVEPETEALQPTRELVDCLHLIQLEVKRGSLVGICGSVGSGKSSLLSAILGDMVKTKGKYLIRGSLAFVSQEAWIYSDTLQENILFGSPMNAEKYHRVTEVSCLIQDLEKLPHKDLTLIGEKGVNLSGGQKARVNLARAVYADKSIYLLDDPLAAVDPIVAKKIFDSCIRTYLAEKTVLLVTHSVQFLENCDEILVMKDGSVVERGTHAALMERREHYHNFLQYHTSSQHKDESKENTPETEKASLENGFRRSSNQSSSSISPKKKTKATEELESIMQKLTEDDTNYKFAGLKSYLLYLKSSGGYWFSLGVFLVFAMFVFCQMFTQVWLQRWLDAGDGNSTEKLLNGTQHNLTASELNSRAFVNDNPDLGWYLCILVGSVVISYAVGLGKGFLSVRLVLRASSGLHEQMVTKVLGATLTFYDGTPIGKIMNRFSKDMDELDARLPFFVEFVVQSVLFLLFNFIVVCMVYPYFSIALFLVLAAMICIDVWLNYGVRETKRLEVTLKTPVIHHIQSSMGGLTIIRTFSRQENFRARFSKYLNQHLSAESVFRFANRWFTVRIEFLGLLTIVGTILIAIALRGHVSPAMVGLALASIYSVCTFVPFVLRMKSELQARFISVERILEYSKDLELEEPLETEESKPPDSWPSMGRISFKNVNLRYKENTPLIFNNISFSINPGEKIGIVGRTGAGKTSILSTLLRLYPIDSGTVLIDDIDISTIPLKCLRSNIAVIPQDPVLFHGTVRYNLDPFDDYTDNEVWEALERTQLKATVEREEKRLHAPVVAHGENFSLGEKQLISLTRALLRKNKIVFLDEATAGLDVETDFNIQRIIRETFADCTVITIAHRLNTVVNYDRILVMDSGRVIEFDKPEVLVEQKDSLFRKMVDVSGVSVACSGDGSSNSHVPNPPKNDQLNTEPETSQSSTANC